MEYNKWLSNKPDFNEECLLITASKYKDEWEYILWVITKIEGENDKGEPGWYWGLCQLDGEEWGDLADLRADKYYVMEPLK